MNFVTSTNINAAVEKIISSIDEVREQWRVPGLAIAVSCRGEDHFYNSGLADVCAKKPFTAETVIPIASVTKPFVAHAVSVLVQKGVLTWDAPVTQYVKDLQFADTEIQEKASLADFLSMRTGLDGYQEWQGIDCNTSDQLKTFISKILPTGSFRESYIYSGLSIAFAAMVIQEVSGRSWTEILEDDVFRPNGIKDYAFSWKQAVEELITAKGYSAVESGWAEMPLTPHEQHLVRADGTLCLSARELLKWLKLLSSHPELQRMITPHVLTHFPDVPLDFWPESYGLCWGRRNYRGHAMAYHRGSEKGFRTVIAILPESDISIAILSNGDRNLLIHLLLNHFLDALLNHNYIPWEPIFEAYRKQIAHGA